MGFAPGASLPQSRFGASRAALVSMDAGKPVIIGLAADSGCGKSTFMRRMTGIFGGESKLLDIGRETNTLVSDMTTVICLDDYHKYDRTGRKSNPEFPDGISALAADCQNWDKMAEDVLNLKNNVAVDKPIYNHTWGALDPDEHVEPTPIVIFEGLHPLYDERVRDAIDLSIYLDITDSVKFAWKAQRDIAAFVEPQKKLADIIIQVLMSDLTDDDSGKFLKVKYIQKKSVSCVASPFLFDKGSSLTWVPNGDKLTSSAPGVKLASYDDDWFGSPVSVVEMDGKIDVLEELIYVESAMCDTGTKYYGELTEQMLKNKASPGSENGSGLFQTLASFKIREAYESITGA